MAWGLATSDARANVLWYRSTVPNAEGLPSTVSDIQGAIWDSFEKPEEVASAWAKAMNRQSDQSIITVAKRNGLGCRLSFYPVPEKAAMVTFSRWSCSQDLTDQELDVCLRSIEGSTNQVIADTLGITVQSVNRTKRSAMRKLGASTPEQLGVLFSLHRR